MHFGNHILGWIAAALLAAGGIFATLNHRTFPYVLMAFSGLLFIIIIFTEVRRRTPPKTSLSIAPRLPLESKVTIPASSTKSQEPIPETTKMEPKPKSETLTPKQPEPDPPVEPEQVKTIKWPKQDSGMDSHERNIPFHETDPYAFKNYTQEQIDNVIWRWRYKLEFDNAPRNLTPFCSECERPLMGGYTREVVFVPSANKDYEICEFWCLAHPRVYKVHADLHGELVFIKEHIQQRIRDGSWLEIVNKQRMARGESPISPDLVAALNKSRPDKPLDEMQIDILVVLWEHSPTCEIHYLLLGIMSRRSKTKRDSSFDNGTFYFHLNDLVEKEFVEVTYDTLKRPDRCSLTQKARQYILNNNLMSN